MEFQQKSLTAGRWAQMSLSEQMANIGSEISRALNWKRKNNEEYCRKAVDRALECCCQEIAIPVLVPGGI